MGEAKSTPPPNKSFSFTIESLLSPTRSSKANTVHSSADPPSAVRSPPRIPTTDIQSGPCSAVSNPITIQRQWLDLFRRDRFLYPRRIGHPYQNRTPPKRKKPRTAFTRHQVMELERRFQRQKYMASSERIDLARLLKMTDAQVKTWFQNRRTKWRRQTTEEREAERQAANRYLLTLQAEVNKTLMPDSLGAMTTERTPAGLPPLASLHEWVLDKQQRPA